MPAQRLNTLQSATLSGFDICGSFGVTGGDGSVDTTDVKGRNFSVAKEATDGQYTITLDGPLADIISITCVLEAAATEDLVLYVAGFDLTARTVTLQAETVVAAAAEANPADGDRIHFRIHCARHSVG